MTVGISSLLVYRFKTQKSRLISDVALEVLHLCFAVRFVKLDVAFNLLRYLVISQNSYL
jgi:hypothetical protein